MLALQGDTELFDGNLTSVNKVLTYNRIAAAAETAGDVGKILDHADSNLRTA